MALVAANDAVEGHANLLTERRVPLQRIPRRQIRTGHNDNQAAIASGTATIGVRTVPIL